MHTRIEILTPIVTEGIRNLADFKSLERQDLTVTHSLLSQGPASIESEFDDALSIPDTIRKAIDAERSGANAIIIDCMADPGLHACREVVKIPVLGPCQTALHTAAMLGHSFAYITVLERVRSLVGRLITSYGLKEQLACFRAVDIPVLSIGHKLGPLTAALTGEAIAAIKEDHADVIVLGCTGFLGCASAVRRALLSQGLDVPVIDPIPLAVHTADAWVKTGLSHSKLTYPAPSRKRIEGYRFPELAEG